MCQIPSNKTSLTTGSTVTSASLSTLPIPDLKKKATKRGSRLKFWELSTRFHCAALGTCLTLKELRQIGNKANIKDINSWDDYCIHVSFLQALDAKCYVSNLVNKLLDKKYKINILYFSKTKTEDERIALWNNAVNTGDIAGAFWAMLTHPDTTEETLYQVYGKVHMLSHLSGATARIDIREFHILEKRNNALQDQIDINEAVYNKKLDKKEKELTQMKTELSQLQQEKSIYEQAKEELNSIKNTPFIHRFEEEIKQLKDELENAQANVERLNKSNQELEAIATQEQEKNGELNHQLSHLADEKTSIESTLASLLNQTDGAIDSCEACPNTNSDLCGRCVLYIGGRNSQYTHFRQLVEQQNGAFIHHDGGREDGHQKLASIVSRADVVVCPLDCVSHTAMNAVKRHCQNNTKQLVFIPHASLSAFSKGLTEVMD
ncbi:DUF2325 domain-containing protein [Cocleimonas flava]|uniref:Uncharacterized protein DUF2325 n=1 Tax=Cocleimonas flava TaxID=634765 RepID=A0A4R1EZI5_9GAMM|nr:DUF2325 domain-containing protein [Cocleimonas flava]TCJ84668.1 uncharacterized protein DUF2325 [Cocleimonas flava]